jgi:hypothetical protein
VQGANPSVLKEKLEAFVPPSMRKPGRERPLPTPSPSAEEAA